MRRRWIVWTTALAAVLGLGSIGLAAPEDIAVGEIRAVVARDGTLLRSEASAMAPRVGAALPYGTRVTVTEVRKPWIRVTTMAGAGVASATGWLRATDTVAPYALTGAGQRGPVAAGTGGTAQLTAAQVAAAGRQLDEPTEMGYRNSHPDVARYYPVLEGMERASRAVDEATLDDFISKGRLGRPGK